MTTTNLKIERIEKPSKDFFEQHIVTSRKPVIITGAIDNWKGYSLWTDDYLDAAVGENQVPASASTAARFMGEPECGNAKLTKEMTFSEFMNLLKLNRNSQEAYYYLAQVSIPRFLPELLQDIELPIYCENRLAHESLINLWLGSGGNISPLHFDRGDNILVQVRGSKKFVFFDPWQTPYLYPFPADCQIPHTSQVDIDRPDLTRFPKFPKAKSCECVLEAGEILFIPAFWWHQVYSLDDNKFPTISVNFWCKVPLLQWLTPPGRRYAVQLPGFVRNEASRWRRKVTKKIKTKLQLKL